MDWSLHRDDDPIWTLYPLYNPHLASELHDIFDRLFERNGHVLGDPMRLLTWILSLQQTIAAPPQVLRLRFALARILMAIDQYTMAIERIDESFELAETLNDSSGMIELVSMRAVAHTALLKFSEAEQDYRDLRTLLHEHLVMTPEVASYELRMLVQLVNVLFFQSKVEDALRFIFLAGGLLAHIPGHTVEAVSLNYTKALIARWRGKPEEAMPLILTAAAYFRETPSLATAARVELAAVDVLQDLAGSLMSTGIDGMYFTAMAADHMRLASALSKEANDSGATGLSILARARHERLLGLHTSHVSSIEQVIRHAQRNHDIALLVQALTALGDEFAARHEEDSSLAMYRQTLAELQDSDLSALGVWARRALHFHNEWSNN